MVTCVGDTQPFNSTEDFCFCAPPTYGENCSNNTAKDELVGGVRFILGLSLQNFTGSDINSCVVGVLRNLLVEEFGDHLLTHKSDSVTFEGAVLLDLQSIIPHFTPPPPSL